jgi:hypothetical protein
MAVFRLPNFPEAAEEYHLDRFTTRHRSAQRTVISRGSSRGLSRQPPLCESAYQRSVAAPSKLFPERQT